MSTIVLRSAKGAPLTNAEMDGNLSNLNNDKIERDGSSAITGKITFVQPSSARASIRLPEGTTDPTTPDVGDMWNVAGSIKFRITAGLTVELLHTGSSPNFAGDGSFGGNLAVTGNVNIGVGSGVRINNQSILTSTTLGSTVVNSNLQRVGTLTDGTWNATRIAVGFGGTGLSNTPTNGQLLIGNGTGYTLQTLTGTANQVTITNGVGTITIGLPQNINTTSPVQFGALGVGTAASGTVGEIRATNEITAYFASDVRLKRNIRPIKNSLSIINGLSGNRFDWSDEYIAERGGEDGYFVRKQDLGLIAQEVQAVLPEAVATRENGFLAVKYERLIPVIIEAIKELQHRSV